MDTEHRVMIQPSNNIEMANRIASQSLQLLKPILKLQFSQIQSLPNKSIGNAISVSNQSITHSLAKFIPDFQSSLNQSQMDLVTGAKINELIVSYRLGVSQNSGILKSIYTVDKMKHYLPLISKLRSLHLPYLQPLEEGLLQQTNVTFSSFFYPNVPISSEYYKYFELFLKKNLPSQSKPDKKRKKHLRQNKN